MIAVFVMVEMQGILAVAVLNLVLVAVIMSVVQH